MKAILFDFGGTLDTNGVHWSEFFWDAYQQMHVPISKKLFEQAYVAAEKILPGNRIRHDDNFSTALTAQLQAQFEFLSETGSALSSSLLVELAHSCSEKVKANVAQQLPFIKKLSQRYALGVVSNFYGNLQASLKELGFAPFIHTAIDSTVVGISKPDPKIFQTALDKLHVRADAAYAVGDSYERDIVPAKQLGCVTVWLRGRSWKETMETSKADYIILSLQELSSLVRI
ncbi:MAG TPA: HAD family hydrolase [Bacteroidota bacterium]|nr:HAD family hydrolase [Bacteroidota bacterium]